MLEIGFLSSIYLVGRAISYCAITAYQTRPLRLHPLTLQTALPTEWSTNRYHQQISLLDSRNCSSEHELSWHLPFFSVLNWT
jgi:hypothetical protein